MENLINELQALIKKEVEAVEYEEKEALKLVVILRKLQDFLDIQMSRIKDLAIEEVLSYQDPTLKKYGAKFSISSGGGTYNYKSSENWNTQKNVLDKIQEQMKISYQMSKRGDFYITEGGEVIEPAEFKPSAKGLKITIE